MIFLDIEVIQQDPYPWMVKPDDEVKIPKNIKDPEKIAERRAEAIANQDANLRDRSSLEPLLGGVIACIGAAVGWERAPGVLINESGDESGERKILRALQNRVCGEPPAGQDDARKMPIVAWNGSKYDSPFLWKRAMRHGLWPLCARLHTDKPWDTRVLDPSLLWRGSDWDSLWAQRDVAQYLGIEVNDDVHGSKVSTLWSTERARVVEHCRSDVHVLREIVRRLVLAGKVSAPEPEGETPIPPPRGSAEDLVARARRLQYTTDPTKVIEALATAGIATLDPGTDPQAIHPALAEILISLPTLPTDQLRAYLVALGGRP